MTTLDELVERLRLLRVWAGGPPYETIKNRVNAAWANMGRPAGELAGKTTIVDCFRLGRRRLNTDLVVAVVQALHPDAGYVAQWRQALRVVCGESVAASQVRVQDTLPQDVAGFTGRAAELDRFRRGAATVSVIEGMAGVGKTQLAVRAGHVLVQQRRCDRILFVNLRGFHPDTAQPPADPTAVLDGFLRLLGVSGRKIPHELDARSTLYRRLLADTRALVVLDNAVDVDQVRPLLPDTPGCVTLITSRRNLADLPGADHLVLDMFSTDDAQRFLTRAAPAVPVGEDPEAGARIARCCGHLPLALGLVVGHMRAKPGWTMTDHADWLDERHRDRRLDTGIELALDLSYQNLSAQRQRVLRLLALHPGHDLDAYATAALVGTDLDTARAHLHHLRDDHLLQQERHGRFTFHDLVRAYAGTHSLDEDRQPDRRAALTRLFDHYLVTTANAVSSVHPAETRHRQGTPPAATPTPDLTDPSDARTWLDVERTTLIAVVAHTATRGWPTHTVRLSRALFRHFDGGHFTDAVTVHEHAHRAAHDSDDPIAEAHALTDLGLAYRRLSRTEQAVECLERALDLFRQAGDALGQARALGNLGGVANLSNRYGAASDHYAEALTMYRQAGDRIGEARALADLGNVERLRGRHGMAVDYYAEALPLHRQVGDREGEAWALTCLGDIEIRRERYEPAREHVRQALDLFRRSGNRNGEASTLILLGTVHTRLGHPADAADLHRRGLAYVRETGDRENEALALNGLGEAALADGRPADAVSHHATARTVAIEAGSRGFQAAAERGLGDAHHALGDLITARQHYRDALTLYSELDLPEAVQVRERLTNLE
ncbi:tetratricopeptide repeat protein [Actinophytocola oryzae]|uniref:tetratricopeptide repeat protein n=1 Tax=Actinophytocola oryzae TaxID=502181 RepID=UPI001FB9CE03|nr:tetratricopeptide repeat protein [Actinophytocola oryzae]